MTAEWIAILSLLLIVAALLAALAWGAIAEQHRLVIVVGLLCPVTFMTMSWVFRDDFSPLPPATNRPLEVRTSGYVGSDSCRKCHPSQHASWHDSYHRTMTQVAHPSTALGNFTNVPPMEDSGLRFQLGADQNNLWIDVAPTDVPPYSPEAIPVRRPLVLTTGSHHMQAYWFPIEDHVRVLGLLPFMFHRETNRWMPRRAAFLSDVQEGAGLEYGRWNDTCLHCHATASTLGDPTGFEKDWRKFETRAAQFGIACEACHGPGEEHLRHYQNPVVRYGSYLSAGDDKFIVNPSKLSHQRSAEVCGQCHSIFGPKTDEGWRESRRTGYNEYKPGDVLDAKPLRAVFDCCLPPDEYPYPLLREALEDPNYVRDRFWPDGMIRVSGREYNGLLDTPCFTQGEMSCLSCHQMHQESTDPRPRSEWTDDQLSPHMRTNQACLQCHESFVDEPQLIAHTHHPAGSSGSLCYNCHMPFTTYGLLKAIRSHQVNSPDVASSLATGRPNACNQCHLDQTLAWSATHLDTWYGIDSPALTDDEQSIAASILWLLKGDAGQRALIAWSLGWKDAQTASGTDWMLPYLAELMTDPYEAIRFIAWRALATIENPRRPEYDILATGYNPNATKQQLRQLWADWRAGAAPAAADRPALLLTPEGLGEAIYERPALLLTPEGLDEATYERLLINRDQTPINLQE